MSAPRAAPVPAGEGTQHAPSSAGETVAAQHESAQPKGRARQKRTRGATTAQRNKRRDGSATPAEPGTRYRATVAHAAVHAHH